MNNANFYKILKKIENISGTLEEHSEETSDLKTRCDEIKRLIDSAATVFDINFLLEQINEIESSLCPQKNQTNFWKLNLNEMAISLRDRLQGESSWKNLSEHFVGIIPDNISLPFLYNNVRTNGFDLPEELQISRKAPRATNKRCEKRNPADLIKPTKVLIQASEVDSHKQKMKICLDKLLEACHYDENQSIPFFNFAINCKSYVQTVYNIFTISFLVREHLATMLIDDNHQLWIKPSSKSLENSNIHSSDSENEDDDSQHQFIISISPREWEMLIKHLRLNKSILPVLWPIDESLANRSEFFNQIAHGVDFVN